MVREGKNRFVDRLLIYRSRLQRRQDPHPAPAFARLLEQNLLLINYKCVLLGERLCARRRFPDRQGLRIHCSAKSFNWTRSASRPAPETNEGAQIDERGVVNARGALWNKRRRVLPEHFLSSCAIIERRKSKIRARTRALLASTIGAGWSNAKLATAWAVYFPIPGSCCISSTDRGKRSPYRFTTAIAVA